MPEHRTRLHLVVPPHPEADIRACFAEACAAGDVASVLAAPNEAAALIDLARRFEVALLTTEAPAAMRLAADGVEVASRAEYDAARSALGHDRIVGAFCGASRHLAMEL